jgi:hypothetical protein
MWLPCAEKSTVLNFQQGRLKVKALFKGHSILAAGTAWETSKTSKNCDSLGNSTCFLRV